MRIVIAAVLSIVLFIGVACSHEEKKTPAGREARAVGDTVQASDKSERQGAKPLVTLQNSRHITAIVDAIHRSLASGGAVKVSR